MSLPSLPSSSFGPSAWGGLDALSPPAAAGGSSGAAVDTRDWLFARHDDGALLGVSASPTGNGPADFRDRLLACLFEGA